MLSQSITKFILVPLAVALLSMPVAARALYDFVNGGSCWRQGDWLINTGGGFVRRGLFGDIFIVLSDLTGLDLLLVVQFFQMSLFALLAFMIWMLCIRTPHLRITILLLASPGFLLFFWASDVQGTMRKEIFILLALALLAFGAQSRKLSPVLPIAAVALFTLGCIGNIMIGFMAPSLIAAFYLLWQAGKMSRRAFGVYTAIILAMSALWLAVSLLFKEVPALAGMCAPLVARGLDPIFCDGAMSWTITGKVDHTAQLLAKITPASLAIFALMTTLSLLPLFMSLRVFAERRFLLVLALLCFVPMLPLYVMATDWGRWVSTSYTAYAFLVLLALSLNRLSITAPPRLAFVFGLLALSLLLTPEHGINWMPGGALRSIAITFDELVF